MFSRKNGEISIEYFDDEFRNIGRFPFLFFWFLNEEWQHSIKGLDELSGIENSLFGLFLGMRGRLLK
jgi:hypothetical protein